MGRVHDADALLGCLRKTSSPKTLMDLVGSIAEELGFDYVSLYSHSDLSSTGPSLEHMRSGRLVAFSTCPLSWSDQYRLENLITMDPRVTACRSTASAFSSDDLGRLVPVTNAHRDMIDRQRRANIGESFTVPIHFPGEPAGSCLFSMRFGQALPTKNFPMAYWIGNIAFETARAMVMRARHRTPSDEHKSLTERQLQCTVLLGRGLTRNEIAEQLGISAETVKKHLDDARLAYGVKRSAQLVTKCLHFGEITIYDLLEEGDREIPSLLQLGRFPAIPGE